MTTCPPECDRASELHCYPHCEQCQRVTPEQRRLLDIFDGYLEARRRRVQHTREWNAQA